MEAVLEQSVMILPLEGVIAERRAELLGLAWHGDTLVLLPQFPEKFAGRAQGAVLMDWSGKKFWRRFMENDQTA